MAEQLNPSADPEVGLFIIATDDESWVRLVEMGITSMRKLIDHIGATAGSVLVSGHALAPRRSAGLCPAVLKRSLFNWCHDSGLRVYVDIEAAVACVTTQGSNPRLYSRLQAQVCYTHTLEPRLGQGYLIQGGVAPHEWVHCFPPGDAQAPPATQVAQVSSRRFQTHYDRLYKSRLCKNWLQWGTPTALIVV